MPVIRLVDIKNTIPTYTGESAKCTHQYDSLRPKSKIKKSDSSIYLTHSKILVAIVPTLDDFKTLLPKLTLRLTSYNNLHIYGPLGMEETMNLKVSWSLQIKI